MVLQNKVGLILTVAREIGQSTKSNECAEYFPSKEGQKLQYTDNTLSCLEFEDCGYYERRLIKVESWDATQQLHVEHIHFRAWKDHGLPIASSFKNFKECVYKAVEFIKV